MKPIIIIPDENQKTITMSIEEFKKTISEVWEEGYKEGQAMENLRTYPYPYITTTNPAHIHYETEGPSCVCSGYNEGKTVDNFINKRTYDKGSSISKDAKINVW